MSKSNEELFLEGAVKLFRYYKKLGEGAIAQLSDRALESLKPEDLSKIIYIRNEGQTVLDAIQRQLAHYPHHVGQILYQGKALKGKEFKALSIPKGGSTDFN